MPFYRREVLSRTVQGRRLDLITISSPANLARDELVRTVRDCPTPTMRGMPCRTRAVPPVTQEQGWAAPANDGGPARLVFVISSRVHPGESPASLMMHGLLSFLASSHHRAQARATTDPPYSHLPY